MVIYSLLHESIRTPADLPIGRWKVAIEVPRCSLEDSEEYLEGENKKMFMQFVRKMLRWDPEERQSARELLTDPWLIGQ
jgi:serine/threonine protein kinase